MDGFFEFWDLPQMQRALVIAAIAGPLGGFLGSFITLRGLAFFSDAIAHSAMTGVALGFLLNVATDVSSPAMQGVLVVFCVAVALFMAWLFETTGMRSDTVMAICFTGSLAFGVLMISKLRGYRVLENALFGDILATQWRDVWIIGIIAGISVLFLLLNMRSLTLLIVNEDLARLEGVSVRRMNYFFVAFVAIVVALLLRYLGAMVISGLIVIPAATARFVSRDFRGLIIGAMAMGLAGALAGVIASYHLDTATGPTIVVTDIVFLLASMAVAALVLRVRRNATAESKPIAG